MDTDTTLDSAVQTPIATIADVVIRKFGLHDWLFDTNHYYAAPGKQFNLLMYRPLVEDIMVRLERLPTSTWLRMLYASEVTFEDINTVLMIEHRNIPTAQHISSVTSDLIEQVLVCGVLAVVLRRVAAARQE